MISIGALLNQQPPMATYKRASAVDSEDTSQRMISQLQPAFIVVHSIHFNCIMHNYYI